MQLHQLRKTHKNKTSKRVGRGGSRGKTSGRGHKGQKAHGNKSPRSEMRDIIKKLPKRRGYGKNRARTINPNRVRPVTVSISVLDKLYDEGERVTPKTLVAKGAVEDKGGRVPQIKILSNGTLSKKLTISDCTFSQNAKDALLKSGAVIE